MSDKILVGLLCLICFLCWVFDGDMVDEFPHNKNKH